MNPGLYLHIPFCEQRCYYCAFTVAVSPEQTFAPYVDRLIREIRLSGLDSDTLVREVRDSRQMLSEIVNAPIEGFSYPYGALDGPAVKAARKAGYVYAVATKRQVEGSLHDWPRTYVGEKDSPLRLGVKLKVSPILARWRHRTFVNQNEPSGA